MKLTKDQKIAILNKTKTYISLDKITHMCPAINYATWVVFGISIDSSKVKILFPELWKYKPENIENDDPWFSLFTDIDGKKLRLEILDKTIKDIKYPIVSSIKKLLK